MSEPEDPQPPGREDVEDLSWSLDLTEAGDEVGFGFNFGDGPGPDEPDHDEARRSGTRTSAAERCHRGGCERGLSPSVLSRPLPPPPPRPEGQAGVPAAAPRAPRDSEKAPGPVRAPGWLGRRGPATGPPAPCRARPTRSGARPRSVGAGGVAWPFAGKAAESRAGGAASLGGRSDLARDTQQGHSSGRGVLREWQGTVWGRPAPGAAAEAYPERLGHGAESLPGDLRVR